jgi:hypothetical protein
MTCGQPSYSHAPLSESMASRPGLRIAPQFPREAPGLDGLLSGWLLTREPLVFLEKMVPITATSPACASLTSASVR